MGAHGVYRGSRIVWSGKVCSFAGHSYTGRLAASPVQHCGDVPARDHSGWFGLALDDPRGCADWPSPPLVPRVTTSHPDGSKFSGTDDLPGGGGWDVGNGNWVGDQFGGPAVVGNPVVHPVQRHCGQQRDPA